MIPLALSFVLAGCVASSPGTAAQAKAGAKAKPAAPAITKPTTVTVEVRDPVEDCFKVKVPKGWHNRAYTSRAYDVHREVVTCVSPNSDTVLFMGDPNVPQYWTPEAANPILMEWARVNPMVKIEPYRPADDYFASYVKRKFGKLSGFKVASIEPNAKVLADLRKAFADRGIQADGAAVNVNFSYLDKGRKMSAMLIGTTIQFPNFWIVDVNGISTAGKPMDFFPMLAAMSRSKQTNPEWTKKQSALHQQRMAQIEAHGQMLRNQHQRNMANIQLSAQRHQTRMQGIWAAGDASMKAYYERSAASDLTHQRFLNYINDENTVVSGTGKVVQVDNGYQRYFVNKRDNTYVGGDIRFDADAIRRLGLNPDDYVEAKIRP